MAGRVAGAMKHFEFESSYRILLAVSPVMIDRRRGFEDNPQRRPLRARNADPRWLLGQCLIHELVAFVQADLGGRL